MTNKKRNKLEVVVGDLFESDAQTWVNTVNTVGVMGKGVAREFRKRFPEMYRDYSQRCERGEVKLGRPYLYTQLLGPQIINFPTKGHWRAVSRLRDIVDGLEYLKDHYRDWGVTSLAVPPLGCGNGGLEWTVVGPTLYQHLAELEIPVELYAPHGTPHVELQPKFLQRTLSSEGSSDISDASETTRLQPSWVAAVAALSMIERNPHGWPVGKIGFQKLMYFANAGGLPIGLQFEKGTYGPYARDLSKIMSVLVNNDLVRQVPSGRMVVHRPGPSYKHAVKAFRPQLEEWRTRIERVADLFGRFRDTRSTELAATVHFAASELAAGQEGTPSEQDVLDYVMQWKQNKKPPFEPREIAKMARSLAMLGWLELQQSEGVPVDDEELVGV